MAFQVRFENLGKLAGAPVVVRPFTVLAGPNSTGKSFFSKALYSVFDAMNANHALMQIQGAMDPLREGILELEMSGFSSSRLEPLEGGLKRLEDLCAPLSGKTDEIAAVGEIHAHLAELAGEVARAYEALKPGMAEILESDDYPFDEDSLKMMESGVRDMGEISRQNPEQIILNGFGDALNWNLTGNFQVPVLSGLKKDPKSDTSLVIEEEDGSVVGRILIKGNALDFGMGRKGLRRLQEYSRVIYLESPIHWKLRGALRMVSRHFLPGRSRRRILAIPKYFGDLDRVLGVDYSGEVAFPEVLRWLTEDVMRGKITLAESGELVFNEFGRGAFSLPVTATGVVNLGLLALLIDRKIIDKGTFLFIDEPESNLHPQWHEEMIRALFELARGGVHVVIATHSVNILKWIEVHFKKNSGDKELVALNHFSNEGVVNGKKEFADKLDDILLELTEPFHKLRLDEMRQS